MAAGRPRLTGPPVPFTGAVLCGGASRRMGADKALLPIGGRSMALRVADALRAAGAAEVFAVGGDAARLAPLGLPVVADDRPGEGPFPATLTALRHAAHDVVAVLSCDLLRPSHEVVGSLLEDLARADASTLGVVPVVDGHHQWTHVVWRRRSLAPLEDAYRAGARSLRRAALDLQLREVTHLEAALLADADTPSDLGPTSADPG